MMNSCSICGNELQKIAIETVREGDAVYAVHLCGTCHVGTTIPTPTEEILIRLYSPGEYRSEGGRRFIALLEHFVCLFRVMRKNRIEKNAGKGRILDIGCGRGLFLAIMRRNGWDPVGVEFSREIAAVATKAYGLRVLAWEEAQAAFSESSLDVITINHVLEHLPMPSDAIRDCAGWLRHGGLLVVAVPNLSSAQAAFGKGDWFHLDLPGHLHHFSERGLLKLLEAHSFSIRKTRRFDWEYNVYGWLQTLLNRTGIRKNLLYDVLRKKRNVDRFVSWGDGSGLLFSLLLLPILFPISLLLSLSESYLLKRGGTVEIYATKP